MKMSRTPTYQPLAEILELFGALPNKLFAFYHHTLTAQVPSGGRSSLEWVTECMARILIMF